MLPPNKNIRVVRAVIGTVQFHVGFVPLKTKAGLALADPGVT